MRTASAGDAVGLGGRQDVAAGEAPRAVDEDPDAEPLALAGGDALDPAGLDGDRFVEPADDAGVRIRRAQRSGRIQGAVGQVSHGPVSLAERPGRASRVRMPYCRGVAPWRVRAGRSQRPAAAEGLGREVDPERRRPGPRRRAGHASRPAESGRGGHAIEPPAGQDHRQADRRS